MNFESSISRQRETVDYVEDDTIASRRRRNRILIAAAVILVLALVAYKVFGGKPETGAPAADSAKQAAHVTVISPGHKPVAMSVSTTGTLAAREEMPVGVAGEGGLVTRVWVQPGTWVQAGQVLASIDRSVQTQEAAQFGASISVAQADARIAQSEVDRAQALVSRGFISKADLDRKRATRDSSLARVRVAQAQLGAARARTGRLDVRAPSAGLVLTRSVEPGQVVSAGSGTLFRIAKGGQMELRAQLAEGDLAHMTVGLSAKVIPVGTTQSFNGQIWQLSPVIDAQSRQGTARIALAYDKALRPGGFASAEITSGVADAPLLPESAVQSDAKGNYVLIIDQAKKVVRRDVKTGPVTDSGVIILTGLTGTEHVVLSAGAFLNPGETVVPQRAKVSN